MQSIKIVTHKNIRRFTTGGWTLWAKSSIGDHLYCCLALISPKIKKAIIAGTKARVKLKGSCPAIHIRVVVVSPTTEPEPPALEAATIATI